MKNKLLVIAGPTAVGKTAISIELAKRLNGEIISTDSMQIYRKLDIGSAKISKEEMDGVVHHMIDIVDPDEEFSVSEFKDMVLPIIEDIIKRGKLPILAGGTGLYINSIICTMNFAQGDRNEVYREELELLAKEKGNQYVHQMLENIDIESYNSIHFNNVKRVIRALEVYKESGKPFSSFREENNMYKCDFDMFYYVLNMDRDKLYSRINKRVDIMMSLGLETEVRELKELGLTEENQSMKGIGYKEVLAYMDDRISLDQAIDMIKQGSRNYAKRQLTWFKKDPRAIFIDKDLFSSEEEIINKIVEEVK